MSECKVNVDTTEAAQQLEQLQQHASLTAKTVVQTTRKGYRSLVLLADIMGETIPMWFTLMSEAALMGAEMFAELATAEALSGWLAFKSAVTFSIALMMFYRAFMISQRGREVENKLNSVLQLGNVWF